MHITGMATDQNGEKYFVIKNSWGTVIKYGGKQYISMPYFRSKTIAILVHKDAVKENCEIREWSSYQEFNE